MLSGQAAPFTTKLIAVVLSVAALALGRAFFIPLALAVCFQALLTPVVRVLGRLRLPAPAGAAIVVVGALAVLGVGAGVLVFAVIARFLKAFLYGVAPSDPIALLGAVVTLLLIAALASWLPARRAAMIDPADALRAE